MYVFFLAPSRNWTVSPAVEEARNLNRWTARDFPKVLLYFCQITAHVCVFVYLEAMEKQVCRQWNSEATGSFQNDYERLHILSTRKQSNDVSNLYFYFTFFEYVVI